MHEQRVLLMPRRGIRKHCQAVYLAVLTQPSICEWVCAGDGQAADGTQKPGAVAAKLNPWPTANLPDGGAGVRKATAAAADAKRAQVSS